MADVIAVTLHIFAMWKSKQLKLFGICMAKLFYRLALRYGVV